MLRLIEAIKSALPGVFVHSIRIGKTVEEDRKRSLLDNMNRQIEEVCEQLAGIPELAEGFNGIGLSQGGQFLRAYIERCNKPRVKKLITLGSQHQGVMAMPGCVESDSSERSMSIEESEAKAASRNNWLITFFSGIFGFNGCFIQQFLSAFKNDAEGNCSWWKRLLKLGVYSPFVRSQVVQAQYFKDPNNLEAYFENNQFLLDINNEHIDASKRHPEYSENLAALDSFYMYIFEEDSVVVPKESGWFGLFDPKDSSIKYLRDLSIYREDRLGLKKLDEEGKLYFRSLPGEHLKLSSQFILEELAEILKS